MEKIQSETQSTLEIRWESLPLVLSVEQVAELVDVGTQQIYDLSRTKDFPARRFGRIIKISRDALRQWMGEDIHKPMDGGWQDESNTMSLVRQTAGRI
ncbi:helix-turn-helix domain-containing protein [Desulfosporosinus lacus]|uniref:DNA binding domain-containing protein, excisionase family n=1 Tax=Desulfosporosinus lacus DSM 15449 TaxID=1121420 RepID=A0A1M5Q5X7_9FIRM|nr:helix-turn-helix domain-containing protein [Desulfosporosinus lacus]SHH09181.1 DNA binding domain-containing protein, excisionase family [Desulfosporosinus lacus DSM 15449]